jgi:hypothetical protein
MGAPSGPIYYHRSYTGIYVAATISSLSVDQGHDLIALVELLRAIPNAEVDK